MRLLDKLQDPCIPNPATPESIGFDVKISSNAVEVPSQKDVAIDG